MPEEQAGRRKWKGMEERGFGECLEGVWNMGEKGIKI